MPAIEVDELEKAVLKSPIVKIDKIMASGFKDHRTRGVILKLKNGKEFSIWGTDGTDVDGSSIIAIYPESK